MRHISSTDHSPLRLGLVAGALSVALMMAVIWATLDRRKPPTTRLETRNGVLIVEIADTPGARAAGLSNRQTLAGIDGLLLKWDAPGRHPIWMAEMRFPLDLVWIDASRRVIAVLTNAPPCDRQPCPLYEPEGTDRSVAVLELRAGAAARYGIATGTSFENLKR